MIEREMALGVHEFNGENNTKLKKLMKGSWECTYTSTTRTVLRNLWLMDFLETLMYELAKDRNASLSHCARAAYDKGLGPNHPWVIRQTAKVAMLAVPSREKFLNNIGADEN